MVLSVYCRYLEDQPQAFGLPMGVLSTYLECCESTSQISYTEGRKWKRASCLGNGDAETPPRVVLNVVQFIQICGARCF